MFAFSHNIAVEYPILCVNYDVYYTSLRLRSKDFYFSVLGLVGGIAVQSFEITNIDGTSRFIYISTKLPSEL